MLLTGSQQNASNLLNRTQLVKLKAKAMRTGVWFRALHKIDRILIDLTIKVVSNIRSITLAKKILVIIKKLEVLLESRTSRALGEVGVPFVQKLSLIAQIWGNASAKSWPSDSSFVRFLAIMYINEPKTFKI